MRVSVIGCGHLGTTHAAAMAELGHDVIGVEQDPEKCRALAAGRVPFFEAGLDELVAKHTASGRLRFSTAPAAAAAGAELHFLAVGTPLRPDGKGYEVDQVVGAVRSLVPLLQRPCTIVGKSTVAVGTVARLQAIIDGLATVPGVELVWNPEFLREGHAVLDTLEPDRILAGLSSTAARKALEEVYAPILARGEAQLVITDPATAEVAKSAANACLAAKISFVNAMAEVCELTGADVTQVARVLGIDPRIGPLGMRPGIGYGGGCLPKDIAAFAHRVKELGAVRAAGLLDAVEAVNHGRREAAVALVARAAGGNLEGVRVGFLGAAFKAGTSDVRDSPALWLAARLHLCGATVVIHDPQALPQAQRALPEAQYRETALGAATGADLLVLGTEWPEYLADPQLPATAATLVRKPVLVDVRTAVDPALWLAAGWSVWQLGCPVRHPTVPPATVAPPG
ncbi:UDP-glucose/GDP-mannose dehydrogenase family protein [Kitasatospora sp. RB6PN24]|uniref:UDP-glucose dehydrogenase family protein n=1 Tax=Kitasatospora humi TaxID=2893891 RepID=UPI001E554072|nr:UDP-glucose/GDP-mannose dehydrogenase family protein [Kitasatospora humi]MCC9305864.1 UDP-glucose/GDP-mannose dehydrogenase family protein [Kitasatospora humi]